eukprot:598970-Pelagomonas_calceolata.AAC.6
MVAGLGQQLLGQNDGAMVASERQRLVSSAQRVCEEMALLQRDRGGEVRTAAIGLDRRKDVKSHP